MLLKNPDSGRVDIFEAELRQRIERYIDRLNEDPVVFKWTYKMDEISVV